MMNSKQFLKRKEKKNKQFLRNKKKKKMRS